MLKELGDLLVSLGEATDEHWVRGTTNMKDGLRNMFSGSSRKVEFKTPVDVLAYLLSEVPNGNCEIAKLSENDDYDTILSWVRTHKKGNKFYLVKGKLKSGESAIGVFLQMTNAYMLTLATLKFAIRVPRYQQVLRICLANIKYMFNHFNKILWDFSMD